MKKIIFKVSLPKDFSIVSLIKKIHKASCRILLDLEHNCVIVENVDVNMIDYIIDLISKYFIILSIDIDNIVESLKNNSILPIVQESENDLIAKKIEFENSYIEDLMNKLLKTAYWAIFKNNISEKEIGEFISTCISEISLTYNDHPNVKFDIGDIVDCNYGNHLPGEINGTHVKAIVCNILSSGMVYLVPLTKTTHYSSSNSILKFNSLENIVCFNDNFSERTALLYKAKYVRSERINSVLGKTTPEFFAEILNKLSSTFDFTAYLSKTNINNSEIIESNLNSDKDSDLRRINTNNKTIIGVEEKALLEVIGASLNKLDKNKSAEDQIEDFLNEIGMSTTSKFVKQSFIVACDINDKINYENILLNLQNLNPNINNINIIKLSIKEDFKNWLKNYPELDKKCPKISLMSVLKVFAKKFA